MARTPSARDEYRADLANLALYSLMYGDPRPGERSPAVIAGEQILNQHIRRLAAAGRLRVSEQHAGRAAPPVARSRRRLRARSHIGAVVGIVGGYLAAIGFFRNNSQRPACRDPLHVRDREAGAAAARGRRADHTGRVTLIHPADGDPG